MSDFEDRHMDFVLKHYQEGKFDTQKAIERFNKTHGIVLRPRRRVFPWVSGIVAAAAAVVLCVFLFRGNDRQIQLMASAGVQEFVLPDGSEVTLAPGSRLTARSLLERLSLKARLSSKSLVTRQYRLKSQQTVHSSRFLEQSSWWMPVHQSRKSM